MIDIPKIKKVIKKAFTFGLSPTEQSFPELPAVLIWYRFVLAVGFGFYAGSNLLRSGPLLVQALNLIAFVPTLYCRFYLNVPGGVFASEVIFSGLVNALALCLLIWIYLFTAAHETQEAQLAALLINAVAPANMGNETMLDGETLVDEQEF